jgi:hypothetical protein
MPLHNEGELEAELLRRYQEGAKLGHRAGRLYQLFMPHCKRYVGGVHAVQYVLRHGKTIGFTFSLKKDRPDLSIESLVIDSKWADAFSSEDREIAKRRIALTQRDSSD